MGGDSLKQIIGYCDPWSVAPGERVRFMVSTYGPERYRASLVRVICGDDRPQGPGYKEEPIPSALEGEYPGRTQAIAIGSYARVPADPRLDELESLTVQAFVWPTTPEKGKQGVVACWSPARHAGFVLALDGARGLALELGDGRGRVVQLTTGRPLLPRRWYFVAASFDAASGWAELRHEPLEPWPDVEDHVVARERLAVERVGAAGEPLLMAALPSAAGALRAHLNGKIDRPRLARRALDRSEMGALAGDRLPRALLPDLVAAWDFARDIDGGRVVDASPSGLHGETVNLPSRGVKGHNWTGTALAWPQAPEQYAAIHFHDDDLEDAGWTPDFELSVPADFRSGAYAVKLEAGGDLSYVTFFVRPPPGRAQAPLAFLASTATYLAYGNYRWVLHEPLAEIRRGHVLELSREEAFLQAHPELGLSTYDTHGDGSGVRFATRLRPILNLGPRARVWSFNADTHILDWLEAKGYGYDLVTDEALEEEGVALLGRYRAVVTGTHPEYWSTPMWQAMVAYQARGGRLLYLGGNGFYWRIAWHPRKSGILEVRRSEDGARYWDEEPGEYWMAWSGEYGGLWRRAGIAPQTLVGIGTRATGFDRSSYYRRTEASFDPRVAFMFAGIGADDLIGDFGSIGGGAAGLEIDATDPRLGTPPHALVVAASEEHSEHYYLAPEETNFHHPLMTGADNPAVRAEIVFYECPQGGAVCSVGSIAWAASLAHAGYDNNVSRLTANVIDRFLDPTPLAGE